MLSMVMFLGAAKAPPVLSVEVPIVTYADLFVDYDAETKSPNRGGRIIKGGMKNPQADLVGSSVAWR